MCTKAISMCSHVFIIADFHKRVRHPHTYWRIPKYFKDTFYLLLLLEHWAGPGLRVWDLLIVASLHFTFLLCWWGLCTQYPRIYVGLYMYHVATTYHV